MFDISQEDTDSTFLRFIDVFAPSGKMSPRNSAFLYALLKRRKN